MSPLKSPSFFASDIHGTPVRPEFRRGPRRHQRGLDRYLDGPMHEKRGGQIFRWEQYLKLFKNVRGETAIGEASVSYLFSEVAAENIRRTIPAAKVFMVLRNPVERAFTSYLAARADGWLRGTFREVLERNAREQPGGFGRSLMFLEGGLYARQVGRYVERFPAEQVRVYLYDDYARDAPAMLRDIFAFLGVDPTFVPDLAVRLHKARVPRFPNFLDLAARFVHRETLYRALPRPFWIALRAALFRKGGRPVMGRDDRRFLIRYYQDDVSQLSRLLGRDLSHWLEEPDAARLPQG